MDKVVGVMWFLFDYKMLPKGKAIESIKADQTISDAVRAKALEFAEQFADKLGRSISPKKSDLP